LKKEADICDLLIEKYLPIVVQLLIEKESPEVICKQIKLCPEYTRANCVKFGRGFGCGFGRRLGYII